MKMKNLTKLAYLGAIAFVGIGFTACSSDDDAVENNPSFDGKAVKTQFAINIPRAATPSSRMSAGNTQNNSNFLGMQDIHLLSFAEQPGANTSYSSDIELADINNGITTTTSSKIYSDVNVPVGTSHFLFYAVAPQGTDATSKFQKGVLDATIGASTDAINFKLQQIATSIEDEQKTNLLSVLNAVATVSNWSTQGVDTGLGKLYASFKNLKAGSANSIRAALENLYNAVAIWADAAGTSDEKTIAGNIRTAIKTGDYFTARETSQGSGVYTLTTTLNYPRNLNLPDGAVQLTFQNNSFSYDNNSGLTSIPTLDPTTLTYPASLYYFISTDIRTSNNTFDKGWPANVTDWASDQTTFWNSFNSDNAKVTATTRAIALKNNIQYGVANLKLSAYCTAQKLSDATEGTQGSTAKTVNVPAGGFKITGVIIGGQPTQVGYNFLPANAQSLTRHIYDKDVASTMCARYATNATDATVNYTMVLPNQLGSNEQTVSFAIEFKNNSSVEFQGVDGVVPVNGKFYLVGKLDPTNSQLQNVTSPAVFMPDYQTTVTAKISTLKKAYNTIPDLRATNMQLGLSVDLQWTPGLTFDIDLGGDTN